MNLFQIFDSIAKVDPAGLERFDTRRAAFGHLFSAGKKITAAAAPVFMTALFNKAYAGEQGVRESVTQVLAYALRLERLEFAFYDQGLASTTLPISSAERTGLEEIRDNENSHVALLNPLVPANMQTMDSPNFTKVYGSVFTDRAVFLAVAQALEDTGVRAYKGRAAELMPDDNALRTALNIHSVEARHAAHIRVLRGERAWITGDTSTIPTVPLPAPLTGSIAGNAFYQAGNPAASYPSEANTTQAGQSGQYAGNGIPAERYSEAFDEPIDPTTVLTTVSTLFL